MLIIIRWYSHVHYSCNGRISTNIFGEFYLDRTSFYRTFYGRAIGLSVISVVRSCTVLGVSRI